MAEFFEINRNLVYFVYGEAFFVLGLAIALQSRKHSQLRWARDLWLLAAFGFVHGIYEWGSVFIPIQQNYLAGNAISVLRIVQLVLEVVSFLALFQFGIELIALDAQRSELRGLPSIMLLLWIIATAVLSYVTVESFVEFLNVWDALARYVLGVPGAVAAAWGLWRQAHQVDSLNMPRIANYLRGAAYAFGVYAALSAIVPRGDFFPATVFNYEALVATLGIPAPIFRAACGIIIALFIIRGLDIFDVETDRMIEETAQAHAVTADRERIGRELHDSIIQSLYGATLTLEDAADTIDRDTKYSKDRIDDVARALNRTIRDIRAYILDLRRDLDGGNWQTNLGEMVREFRLQTLIDSQFTVSGIPGWELSERMGKEIQAIAREGLANAARHSDATHVSVRVSYRDHQIELEIADNGVGFTLNTDIEPITDGHQGLANIRERARLIGARLKIDSMPSRGTRIQLVVSEAGKGKEEGNVSQDHDRG